MADQAARLASLRSPSTAQANTLQPLRVTYYQRMRPGRAHLFLIRWKKAERGLPVQDVTVKLQIAGAHVVPAEQTLSPADPEASAGFYVTPLAQGRLPHSVLEVFYRGAKIHEMALPCRVSSHGRTWVFLFLTFLLPALLLYCCKYHPYLREGLTVRQSTAELITDNLPRAAGLNDALGNWLDVEGWIKHGIEEVAGAYASLCWLCHEYPVAFYTAALFFLLTVFSAWHRGTRKRLRQSAPIRLPEACL